MLPRLLNFTRPQRNRSKSARSFEKLDGAFVPLSGRAARKRAEISTFARTRILLAGVQPILSGWQFPYHALLPRIRRPLCPTRLRRILGRCLGGRRNVLRATALQGLLGSIDLIRRTAVHR